MKFKNLSKKQIWGCFFVLPWIIYFTLFLAYPMFLAFRNSFLNLNLLTPAKASFVGFGNWIEAASDPLFWQAMFNIVYNQTIFIILSLVLGLSFAVFLKRITTGAAIFRTVYFLPVITSITVAMIVFKFISGPEGPIQAFLLKWDIIKEPVFWKFSKWLPMPVLALFNSWKWFGVQMVIFLGGLSSIDQQLYEAAEIDGASWFKQFVSITLPLLKPQIVFVLTMNIINGLQMFTEVFMNFDLNGGPYHAALTPVLYLYSKAFDDMQMGDASAIGILLAAIIYALTMLEMRVTQGNDEKEVI
ncbi:permease component of ABC-type sugar transporter [Halobacteroides halobius DSM 5150]|uniref:Permease component of ABC-type sugar transporter n=1 Tax=Halobacteroides halobius (strain ATCC 35273 / DSM 5150 / MD-1) TaxID=748449 RepID=L0K7Z9_HALHC|nr:sugar ABC transporter permease [Halobacteroides halobius]AGB40243.1 permease component of ABC-type sugar transporter [Halobacteroides halobius DSM 5150]